MSLLVWLYSRFNPVPRCRADQALSEAKERLVIEEEKKKITESIAERAIRSRLKNGYGEALRRALGGRD